MKTLSTTAGLFAVAFVLLSSCALADILELKNGTVMMDCYVRDEGPYFQVWESMDKVGTPDFKVIYRKELAPRLSNRYTRVVDGNTVTLPDQNPCKLRDKNWDVQPQLQDLSVTFIEMNPKLAGLHGRIDYTEYNTPCPKGAPAIDKRREELGEEKIFLEPEYLVQDLKLKYEVGEEITFTAHVKNFGFITAKPFAYKWYVDDKEVGSGKYSKSLKELEETSFDFKWDWQEGKHTIAFEVVTDEKEIATINNKVSEPMWGFPYFYIVTPGRANVWHEVRSAYGTFSWEDFYRWHVDIMNKLFEQSIYPSSPQGIQARVRLDRILYLDDVDQKTINKVLIADDGIAYHQGGWIWRNDADTNRNWKVPDHTWRNQTEWSLPHELGHQLGLVDYYAIDYGGSDDHVWQDNGEKITHFQNHPSVMMHWHGPNLFSEISAMYFNQTWDKPRGYFGDHYFQIPDECFLNIVDINGQAVPNAKVECFQRGTEVDTNGKPGEQEGVAYYPVIEDENFGKPCSKLPVIVGRTGKDGMIRLPNRPAFEVKTLNGYHRKANPWGNINVVGGRGLMLVKVTVPGNQPAYFFLEAVDFNLACYTGHQDKYTVTLETPFGSVNSPKSPVNVRWQYIDGKAKKQVKVTWQAPNYRQGAYLETPVAYRVYTRDSDMGLNDREWSPVATTNPNTFEAIINLDDTKIKDVDWFTRTVRFGVTSIAQTSTESGIVQARDMNPKE